MQMVETLAVERERGQERVLEPVRPQQVSSLDSFPLPAARLMLAWGRWVAIQ